MVMHTKGFDEMLITDSRLEIWCCQSVQHFFFSLSDNEELTVPRTWLPDPSATQAEICC